MIGCYCFWPLNVKVAEQNLRGECNEDCLIDEIE